jgi:hypothetical protein
LGDLLVQSHGGQTLAAGSLAPAKTTPGPIVSVVRIRNDKIEAAVEVSIGEGSAAAAGFNVKGTEIFRTRRRDILDPMQQHVFDQLGYAELAKALREVPTFDWANRAGLKPTSVDEIEVRGGPIERARRAFARPRLVAWNDIRPFWGAREI